MDFKQARADSTAYTQKASDVGRNLALAGLAITWVASGGGTKATNEIDIGAFGIPIVLLVAALAVDFLQYAGQAAYMRHFIRANKEELEDNRGDVKYPEAMRNVADVAWLTKVTLVAVGHTVLLVQLAVKFL